MVNGGDIFGYYNIGEYYWSSSEISSSSAWMTDVATGSEYEYPKDHDWAGIGGTMKVRAIRFF